MYYIAYVTEILVAPLDWPIMSISKNIDSNWRNIMSNIWDEIYHSRVHFSCICQGLDSASAFSFQCFPFFFLFFFFSFMHFRETKFIVYNYSSTVYALFTEPIVTLFRIKILKIGLTVLLTHLKIILLQCFQFSVFSFQFSVSTKISSIQTAPIYNQCPTHRLMLGSKDVGFMYLES